jgi:hypothetical protein
MTTCTEPITSNLDETKRRDELERLFAELRGEREARQAADHERARRRRNVAGFATAAVVAVVIGGGAALIITDHSNAAQSQAASGTAPAAAVTPAHANPEIPSGNNIGNMGTGGGPMS